MANPIPQPIADALDAALQAKIDVDAATAVKQQTAASSATASQADQAAAADLAAKATALDAARRNLESLEDAFLTPGGAASAEATKKSVSPASGK
jgi:predicted flavoprotein YhiN